MQTEKYKNIPSAEFFFYIKVYGIYMITTAY